MKELAYELWVNNSLYGIPPWVNTADYNWFTAERMTRGRALQYYQAWEKIGIIFPGSDFFWYVALRMLIEENKPEGQ